MNAQSILEAIAGRSALVVGDVCLDRWCTYDPAAAQPSAETGISRIAVVASDCTPGAGGTVANNLAALGVGCVAVLGVIGTDGSGYDLLQGLRQRGIHTDALVRTADIQTFTYTKLLNLQTGVEDLPRVDTINVDTLPESAERELVDRLLDLAPKFDVLLVSDQAETDAGGVVTPAVRAALAQVAGTKRVWVDSRRRIELFPGAILKPNEREAREAGLRLGVDSWTDLRRVSRADKLVVTLGERGAIVVDAAGERLAPGRAIANPVDICGAGDSFSAGAAMAYSVTGDIDRAAWFGSLVASITVGKRGTGTASPEEVLAVA